MWAGWTPSSVQVCSPSGEHPTPHVYDKTAVIRGMKDTGRCPWGHVVGDMQRERLLRTQLERYSWKEALHVGGRPSRDCSHGQPRKWLPNGGKYYFWEYCSCGQGQPWEPLLWGDSYQSEDTHQSDTLRVTAIADPRWGRGKPFASEEKQTETIKHTTQSLLGHTFPHLRNWYCLSVTHGIMQEKVIRKAGRRDLA